MTEDEKKKVASYLVDSLDPSGAADFTEETEADQESANGESPSSAVSTNDDAEATKDDSGPEEDRIEGGMPLEPEQAPIDCLGEKQLNKIRKFASWSGREGKKRLDEAKDAFDQAYPGNGGAVEEAIRKGKEDEKLIKIRKFASWSGREGEKRLDEAKVAFNQAYPGNGEAVKEAIRKGKEDAKLKNHAYKLAVSFGHTARGLEELQRKAKKTGMPRGAHALDQDIEKGNAAYQRRKREKEEIRRGGNLSSVKQPGALKAPATALLKTSLVIRPSEANASRGLHSSDLRTLKPAKRWRVLIDETGSDFGPEAAGAKSDRMGRFVGLVLPDDEAVLKPLSVGWHAVKCTDNREIDNVFQAVLDAEAGVLGICVTCLPVTPGERWMDGVGMLVDWIIRLLPLDGATEIKVLVENRGSFRRGNTWDLVAREAMRKLAISFPSRAALVDLDVSVIGKHDSPFNGYCDALAFTWARTSPSSKARLEQSGLQDSCLLESNPRDLLQTWDAFSQGIELPPATWWNLLASPDIRLPSSLLATLLELVGQECQTDKVRWDRFLTEVRFRMAAGAVELEKMALAIDWLQRFQPEDSEIPPLARLAWLTVQLARSNHFGETESRWMKGLEEQGARLIDEDAPLVCHADLHLAVAFTNRFDFENAGKTLEKWKSVQLAVPGLRRWGQVQSSFGQHAAFQGKNGDAITFFNSAIDAFERLSDPSEREKEIAQTATYRAIAFIDHDDADSCKVREAVERVTGSLELALKSYPSDVDPANRYSHHLALRWLVAHGDEDLKAIYVAGCDNWETGTGHPWPLIQLYRAMLIAPIDRESAVKLAEAGAEAAFDSEQGPTVNLIGACCRAVGSSWGHSWPESVEVLKMLSSQLPLASSRIDFLSLWLSDPGDPVELLKRVLPFNFR